MEEEEGGRSVPPPASASATAKDAAAAAVVVVVMGQGILWREQLRREGSEAWLIMSIAGRRYRVAPSCTTTSDKRR